MRTGGRVFSGLMGMLLLGSGVYAVFIPGTTSVWRYVGSALLVVLGGNALYGAITGREPWIARIGPVP